MKSLRFSFLILYYGVKFEINCEISKLQVSTVTSQKVKEKLSGFKDLLSIGSRCITKPENKVRQEGNIIFVGKPILKIIPKGEG